MNAKQKLISIGTLLLSLLLIAAPSGAQKSLSDGVNELAANLAKSYGDGTRGKVAIVPLRVLGGGENLLGTYIAETLTNSFFEVGYRDIVERQMLDRALQELKLSLTGMIDADSAKKIGKFLHADLVVGGTMTDLGNEVSVNCRMLAVETGQVVAVATTKIVKDDIVKGMWSKPGTAAGGGGESRPPAAGPEPAGEAVQEWQGISFRLKSCVRRGTTVACELSVTALEKNAFIRVLRNTRLVDAQGNETETSLLSFSGGDLSHPRVRTDNWGTPIDDSGLELAPGVARTGFLRFEGVEATGDQVPLIEIRFSTDRYGLDHGQTQFRNVRVKGSA